MADTFFSQLDFTALHTLLERTTLHDMALITVGSTLYIESCNAAAAQLTDMHPLERIDPLLSEMALNALRGCITDRVPHTVAEELDGIDYRLEFIPHREGALIAFLRDEETHYNGSLRIIQAKSAGYLSALLSFSDDVQDPVLSAQIRKQCLRLHRMLIHSDFLHDPPQIEQLALYHCDLTSLCLDSVETARRFGPQNGCKNITVQSPEYCDALINPPLIRKAVYNLLSNALKITPADGDIVLTLIEQVHGIRITVADRGPGMDAHMFQTLLNDWKYSVSLIDYLALSRERLSLGLGLPTVQRIAQLHGGSLMLSPRDGGGSEMHMTISYLPESLTQNNMCAPMVLEDGYSLEEIEFSIFD